MRSFAIDEPCSLAHAHYATLPTYNGGWGAPFKCNSVKWRRSRAEPELDWWPWSIVADTPPLEYFNVLDLHPCQHIFTSSFKKKHCFIGFWQRSLFLRLNVVKNVLKEETDLCLSKWSFIFFELFDKYLIVKFRPNDSDSEFFQCCIEHWTWIDFKCKSASWGTWLMTT